MTTNFERAEFILSNTRMDGLSTSYQVERAQAHAILALAESLRSQDVPERHTTVEAEVIRVADGRTVGDVIDTLGFDGFPIGVVGPSIFVLAGEGIIRIDEDQRVFRA